MKDKLPRFYRTFVVLILALWSWRGWALAAFPCADPPTLDCLEPLFANVLKAVLALVGVGSFLFLMAGGFKYLTSGGDAKAVASAQKTITVAVAGLILSIALYYIVNSILGLFGLYFHFVIPAPSPE